MHRKLNMDLRERIRALAQLGEYAQALADRLPAALAQRMMQENPWFTPKHMAIALRGVAKLLDQERLEKWTKAYRLESVVTDKIIGVIAAGNIPLVGFHDFLTVLIAGQRLQAKLSRQDHALPTALRNQLVEIEPRFAERIAFVSELVACDGAIATGGSNTARYFKHQLRGMPHIIRSSRSSCAVLSGSETSNELERLGADIFYHFGLGCRSVSKLYVPQGYDFSRLQAEWAPYWSLMDHSPYVNNYRYQKAILLTNATPFIDLGFALWIERGELISPIATVYYEPYENAEALQEKIERHRSALQCVVGEGEGRIPFGEAQYPEVWEYADNIDTLQWVSAVAGAAAQERINISSSGSPTQ